MVTDQLLKKYPIISDQMEFRELHTLLRELEWQLQHHAIGNVVELGCYVGTTSLFIQRLLVAYRFQGEFHVYDSFAGLPPKTVEDQSVVGDQFIEGELYAPRKIFVENFKKAGLPLPRVHKTWFHELSIEDMPSSIFFAFFDGDYYESIRDSFRVCASRVAARATIVIDDYASDALPGVARATDEWSHRNRVPIHSEASLAILHLSR